MALATALSSCKHINTPACDLSTLQIQPTPYPEFLNIIIKRMRMMIDKPLKKIVYLHLKAH